jgi:hypothetical protein
MARMNGREAQSTQRRAGAVGVVGAGSVIEPACPPLPFAVHGIGELHQNAAVFGEGERVVGAEGDDQVVAGGEVALGEAEGLADEALEAVAGDGGADGAADGEAEAAVGEIIRAAGEGDGAGAAGGAGAPDGVELAGVLEAEAARESKAGGFGRGLGR